MFAGTYNARAAVIAWWRTYRRDVRQGYTLAPILAFGRWQEAYHALTGLPPSARWPTATGQRTQSLFARARAHERG